MGNRANIAIKQDTIQQDGTPVYIYLYTHWDGSRLPHILQSALKRGKGRWGDEQYLNRIIFSEMIKDDVLSETGYGLSTEIGDNSHLILYVDNDKMTVTIGDKTWSFSEYVGNDSLDDDLKALEY